MPSPWRATWKRVEPEVHPVFQSGAEDQTRCSVQDLSEDSVPRWVDIALSVNSGFIMLLPYCNKVGAKELSRVACQGVRGVAVARAGRRCCLSAALSSWLFPLRRERLERFSRRSGVWWRHLAAGVVSGS